MAYSSTFCENWLNVRVLTFTKFVQTDTHVNRQWQMTLKSNTKVIRYKVQMHTMACQWHMAPLLGRHRERTWHATVSDTGWTWTI